LTTFPIMALCLLFTGFAFYAPDTAAEGSYNTLRVGLIAAGIYLFMAVYSPGEGPVPFTYSAEAFPLYIRDTGMSFATATCWGFNFIISFTWPALLDAFGPTGAFGWYAAWNAAATVYCYFLLPETKVRPTCSSSDGKEVTIESHAGRAGCRILDWKQGTCPVLQEQITLVLAKVHSSKES
jgi:hypothetical protein